MKLTVVGTGYVGLVSGACLAEMGNDVLCLDVDANKIAILEGGGIPIHEPGLDQIVARNVAAGRLRFTTDVQRAVAHGQLQFIAVGTPPDEDGSADLKYVLAAARNIGLHMNEYKVVVDKSTVPVGTADKVRATIAEALAERGAAIDFSVVSNPEFLKEGAAVDDFMRPDRIIVGVDDERATRVMRELYAPFQRNHDKLVVMDLRSAELTKYAANAMLATRISLHERAGAAGRACRCRHRAGAPGHRQRPAHRLRLPVFRLRLRRLVLSQGRQGADPHRRRGRARPAGAARGGKRQRSAEARADREDRAPLRRRSGRAAASRCGAWPSSPTPTTCARHRAAW